MDDGRIRDAHLNDETIGRLTRELIVARHNHGPGSAEYREKQSECIGTANTVMHILSSPWAEQVTIDPADSQALGTGRSLALFRRLLPGKPVAYEGLADMWHEAVTDDAISKALRRMEEKLVNHRRPYVVVTSDPASISRRT